MKHLAFATMEMYPLTAGGIGRVLYNMLVTMSETDRQRSVVILVGETLNVSLARVTFPEVRFECLEDVLELQEADRFPPERAYSNTTWHWRSVCVLRKLLKLEREGLLFDYIEFPDWGGLGFAAIQEKLFSAAFLHTTLAVRLHSTEGVIHSAEAHVTDRNALALYDLERKALRDCDRVIAQIVPVADYNRSLYGFAPEEWDPRIVLHASPILIDQAPKKQSLRMAADTPLLFTSKFQQVKAPDVFVRASVGFMRLCPEYCGEVRFLAHNTDSEFVDYVKKLIPEDLAHRFRFYGSAIPHLLREQLISEGIVIFPSRFESLCLAAYEASMLGAAVVLNGNNPAFGANTPWQDGDNCIKYSGSVESLVGALQQLFKEPIELATVKSPDHQAPWQAESPLPDPVVPYTAKVETPLVSVIVPNFNLGDCLPYTIRSVVESSYPNIEIIVCDDASTDPLTKDILGRLEESTQRVALRIVYAQYNRGLAGARNLAIKQASGKYVLTLDADDFISQDFIATAVGALERNPRHSIVVPQTAYFVEERSSLPRKQSEYLDFSTFHGEAFSCGFFENRFSTATMLARRSIFDEIPYREELRSLEDWDFYLRSAIAGKRFIVTNELHFFYRKRRGSMISALSDPIQKALCYDELRRIQTMKSGCLQFPAYAMSAWQQPAVSAVNEYEIERLREELNALRHATSVRVALHVSNVIRARAPWLAMPLKRLGARAWEMYSRLRGRRA